MNDICLLIKSNSDKVFTRAGYRVEITDLNAGLNRCLIRGIVVRGEKRISHWWDRNGLFRNNPNSPLTLTLKNRVAMKNERQYPDAFVVLWTSLECTNFSKSKGGQPRDADSWTQADQNKFIGNAVEVNMARVLCEALWSG